MVQSYQAYAERLSLVEVPPDYDPIRQLKKNVVHLKDGHD